MLLAEKGVTQIKQILLDALKGEPKSAEQLHRHPFDGMRLLETTAITRYLNDVLSGRPLIPATPKDRPRTDMIIGIINSYGYAAPIGGVAAFHGAPGFTQPHWIADGASELLVEVLGEPGRHARSAMVAAYLPFGSCLEIELIAEVLGP